MEGPRFVAPSILRPFQGLSENAGAFEGGRRGSCFRKGVSAPTLDEESWSVGTGSEEPCAGLLRFLQ